MPSTPFVHGFMALARQHQSDLHVEVRRRGLAREARTERHPNNRAAATGDRGAGRVPPWGHS